MKAAILRGGTSKGVFFRDDEFPYPRGSRERDDFIRRAFGVPDPSGMQIDGLGGGISSTSKVVFVSKSKRSGFALDYDFGQVGMVNGNIDWSGSCGNLASAVLLFAKVSGLLGEQNSNQARVWQMNVQEEIHVKELDEEVSIAGVPGKSKAIELSFMGDPQRPLLPTGNVVDQINSATCTLLQGANPTIFIKADDPAVLSQGTDSKLDQWIDSTRELAAKKMRIPCSDALRLSFVQPPMQYTASSGQDIIASDFDVFAKITAMAGSRRFHHAFTGTGSTNLAIAALIPGTIVNQCMQSDRFAGRGDTGPFSSDIRMGHPGGIMNVKAKVSRHSTQGWQGSVQLIRTARLLMSGLVYI